MTPLYVTAAADYVECIRDDAPATDLKALVAEATGQSVRRIGRFTQLALIGAGRSARAGRLASDAAVYVGSSHGDVETIADVLRSSLRDGRAPKPLSFVNTVSNATCYYVAQTLKLLGRSTFVCNRYFAFESVLQLAALDLNIGEAESALIGTVDVVVPPLTEHRARVGVNDRAHVADASHWIVMTRERRHPSLCRLVTAQSFTDRVALLKWIASQQDHEQWILSTGQFMTSAEARTWSALFATSAFDYREQRAHYDSHSGATIHCYAQSCERRPLLHINRDRSQRYSIMLLDKE